MTPKGYPHMRRFELVEGKLSKFWEISVESSTTTVRYGRIGASGRTQTKEHGSVEKAEKAALKLVAEKKGKGYVEAAPTGATDATPSKATSEGPAEATPMLSAANEKKLLAKLAKADDAERVAKLLGKQAPGGDVSVLLTDLALRQKLGLQRGVVELLQLRAEALDPTAIHAYLASFGDACVGKPGDDYRVLPGLGREELVILARSYERHPDYWDAAALEGPLQHGRTILQARVGQSVDPAARKQVVDGLVDGVVEFVDLPENTRALGVTSKEWGAGAATAVIIPMSDHSANKKDPCQTYSSALTRTASTVKTRLPRFRGNCVPARGSQPCRTGTGRTRSVELDEPLLRDRAAARKARSRRSCDRRSRSVPPDRRSETIGAIRWQQRQPGPDARRAGPAR